MRIPLADFGNRTADYPTGQRPQMGDGGIGAAGARIGETITNAALGEMDYQRRVEEHAKRERIQDLKEQARAREVADRARAGQIGALTRESLEALGDQHDEDIQTGALDKTKATDIYRKRAQELIASSLKDVPDAHRAAVEADLAVRTSRVEGKVIRAVTKRDRSDTLAGMESTVEYAQRLATTDEAKGLQMGRDVIAALGPHTGLPPAELARREQKFVEGVAYTRAYTGVMTVKDNNALLKKVDAQVQADTRLDPQKQIQLLTTSAGFQAANAQRAEAAAARAQRQQEAHLKRAEAEFNVFQALADKGGVVDPAYVARLAEKTAGTPYQAGIKALAQQAVETGGLAVQPISRQRAELQAVDAQIAKSGRTPELDKRRGQVEKVLRASEADAKKDGLAAYVERGGGVAPKIDASNPTALADSLDGRIAHAQRASQWAEKPVSPLFDPEADLLRDMLMKLPDKEQSQAVQVLANKLPPAQAAALARQMDPKNEVLGLMFANSVPISRNQNGSITYATTSEGRIATELLARGARAKKDGTSTKGEKVPGVKESQWKANIAVQLEGLFSAQTLTDSAVQSALYIAHGMASEQGGALSDRDLKTAVGLAVGGSIAELNGRKVPLPAGIELEALERRLRTMTPAELQSKAGGPSVRAGGVEIPISELARRLPGAELMLAGRGKYMVIVQGRPVVGANGPVLIDVQ